MKEWGKSSYKGVKMCVFSVGKGWGAETIFFVIFLTRNRACTSPAVNGLKIARKNVSSIQQAVVAMIPHMRSATRRWDLLLNYS